MDEYALIKDGALVEIIEFPSAPEVATHKGYSALPVVRETVNNATQEFTSTSVVATIEPTRYLIQKIVSDLSQAEIDAKVQAAIDSSMTALDEPRSVVKAIGAVLFDVVNEVRSLQSQPALTSQQFKNYVRGKL